MTRDHVAGKRSIVVYGAGAVGGYLGGKLALGSGNLAVVLVGRPGMSDAVRNHGLILREGSGESIARLPVVTSSDGLEPCDLVVLTVRTYDVESAIPNVRRLMGDTGLVMALQNGVGTDEMLAASLGRDRLLAGTLTVSVGMDEPGIITRFSARGGIALSTMNARPVESWIVEAFVATGLETVVLDDHRALRWSKLLLNMLGAPITAILDADLATITAHPSLFRLEQLAFREAVAVMNSARVRVTGLPGYPVPLVRLGMRLPRPLAQRVLGAKLVRARGGRSPGMRADVIRGRTEVAAFHGAIASEARRVGLRAPTNEAIALLIQELAAHPEHRETYRGKPEELLAYMAARGIYS